MPLAELLLPEFDEEMTATRRVRERVPDGKGSWKPHPKSMTEFKKPWAFKVGGRIVATNPKFTVYRRSVLNHLVHHRGQLTVYLRLNGALVPAVYGPTADEPNF